MLVLCISRLVLDRKVLLQVIVIPSTESDLRVDLAQAGVYFEVTEQALIKLRYQVRERPMAPCTCRKVAAASSKRLQSVCCV